MVKPANRVTPSSPIGGLAAPATVRPEPAARGPTAKQPDAFTQTAGGRRRQARATPEPQAPRDLDLTTPGSATAGFERLVTRVGETAARVLLAETLFRTPSVPTDVVGWLRERFTAGPNEQTALLGTIIAEATGGGTWVDIDGDGAPNEADVVVRDGRAAPVDPELRDRTRISAATVRAALAFNAMNHPYGPTKLNPSFWEPAMSRLERDGAFVEFAGPLVRESATAPDERSRGGVEGWHHYPQTFMVRPGVRPSDAVRDLFATRQTQECATAKHTIYLKSILDVIGPEDFDRAFDGLVLGPYAFNQHVSQYLTPASAAPHGHQGLLPGDAGYVANPDVSAEAEARRGPGENVVYIGGGRLVGHPIGVMSYSQIVDELASERRPDATQAPHMKDRLVLDPTRILAHDTIPGSAR